jgi:uncharacterized protein (TIGR02147 family)
MTGVFDFIDYRKFLGYFYQEQKRLKKNFSYRYFALKAGFASPSFLKAVMEGKRNLSPKSIEQFCTAINFNTKEARYFTHLVLFNQAKTAMEKQEYYAVLRTLAGAIKEDTLKNNQYDYYDKWYTPILRELLCLHDFRNDFNLIAKTVLPPITPAEAKKSVDLLLKHSLIARNSNGSYRQTSSAIKADGALNSQAVRSFMESVLEHAKQALHSMDKSERHLSSITLGVSPAAYLMLVEEIHAFKDRVKAIVKNDDASSRVYHLNLGLFPGSRSLNPSEHTPPTRLGEAEK